MESGWYNLPTSIIDITILYLVRRYVIVQLIISSEARKYKKGNTYIIDCKIGTAVWLISQTKYVGEKNIVLKHTYTYMYRNVENEVIL